MNKKIIILNGPNLNLLGSREDTIYGSETLDEIKIYCENKCRELKLDVDFFQSNNEEN